MRPLVTKLTPAGGVSRLLHIGLNLILPLLVFMLVRLERTGFTQLALAIILLSKWRMFAVRPRFWLANIRANAVDIMVGVSLLLFMSYSSSWLAQFAWAVVYGVWLVAIKPSSNSLVVSLQAAIGMLCGLMALFLGWGDGPLFGLVGLTALICFLAARHFFDSFEEAYARLLAYIWGYFAAALVWVLGHWLLFYDKIAQPTVFLLVIGYGIGALYYLEHHGRLTRNIWRQLAFIMTVVVLAALYTLLHSTFGGNNIV